MNRGHPTPRLIIGGPHDGEVYPANGMLLRLPVRQLTPSRYDPEREGDPMIAVTASEAAYRPFHHALGEHKFCVWVPLSWSNDQAAREVFGRIAELWAKSLTGSHAKTDADI